MSEGIPTSRVALVDTIGLRIQELHASGKLAGDQPLLRIDNSEQARQAPFQFDAARGQLHRTGCRAIPPTSRSALYGVWEIGTDGAAIACPRCNPMGKPAVAPEPEARPQQKAKQDEATQPEPKQGEAKQGEAKAAGGRPQDDHAVDMLYGVLSIVSQFGGVLRERGQEYRKSGVGAALGDRIEKIYAEVNERERSVLDVLTASLGTLAAALREIEGGLNSERTHGAGPRSAEPSAARPRQDEAQ
jgi:hypothetical protein